LSAKPLKIVSLVPSLTELVCELGLGAHLVGRTGYCIHPAQTVAGVPKVGGTKTINLKKIRELAPTHVILNKDENRLEDADALKAFVPNLVVTHPLVAADNLAVYQQFGEVFDCQARAQELAQQFSDELALCRAQAWVTKKVLYLIWKSPWMTVSQPTYIASMLREVGLEVVGPTTRELDVESPRYPQFESQDAAAWNADAILFSSEPYQFSASDFGDTTDWASSTVPRSLIDGEMLSWYGPRAIAGLRYLRKFRHDLFEE
jgi:ABC-type Fe3+-hydroxamate transport system substrate-binding protein